MNEDQAKDFFINLLRPVLLKVVAWINRNYGTVTRCTKCDSSIVKFE
jgi:hypothetical protein